MLCGIWEEARTRDGVWASSFAINTMPHLKGNNSNVSKAIV